MPQTKSGKVGGLQEWCLGLQGEGFSRQLGLPSQAERRRHPRSVPTFVWVPSSVWLGETMPCFQVCSCATAGGYVCFLLSLACEVRFPFLCRISLSVARLSARVLSLFLPLYRGLLFPFLIFLPTAGCGRQFLCFWLSYLCCFPLEQGWQLLS